MTTVTFHMEGERICGFDALGHSGYAEAGCDIVCAAVTSAVRLVDATVNDVLGLAASGLNGQNFAFVGYVPQDGSERTARIKELESLALRHGQTQQFIETPYRNAALWQALLQTLQPNTRLALASGLTLETTRIESHLVREWRQHNTPPDNRTPVVFAIGR